MSRERAREIFERIKNEGEKAIDAFILTRRSEELFLDFKRSADDGEGTVLHHDDRKNLAKAISGFANSEGGVVVWGVDCSKDNYSGYDVARAKMPIEDVDKFVAFLEGAVSGCTIPAHNKIENHGIKQKGRNSGFVITLVPKSPGAPHQAVYKYYYYMRAGSNFLPVTHSILAGMFGKRPYPHIVPIYDYYPPQIKRSRTKDHEIIIKICFTVNNNGVGIAHDIFINIDIATLPGPNCKAWYDVIDKNIWMAHLDYGHKLGVICKNEFRLAPKGVSRAIVLNLSLKPPFTDKLKIESDLGSEGAEPFYGYIMSEKERVEKYYEKILKVGSEKERHFLVAKLINI
ncbi:MAG: ATP-binding protein [Candidatus Omnitrophica bacterium]|nr:ATP-binding protein [Candidatus Omnitrophota bacterium]